ncbi:MAG: sulfite exporter TauE/SafE family protein [Gammaproteobacteria bacterium]|nr:sulfite exporter TauE/SafE family protein [Gammaproteobacteria bacterium]
MTPIDPVSLGVGSALLLGLGFGAGPCNVACLPFLGPVFMAGSGGVRGSWRVLLPFSLGRLSGYALLGAAAGSLGVIVTDWIVHPWVHWLLGGATIVVALSILRRRRTSLGCASERASSRRVVGIEPRTIGRRSTMPGGLFFMGAGMALNPCAPLTMVVLAAATTASPQAGAALGVAFGVGAVLLPTLIFALGVAHLGEQVRLHLAQWRTPLESASVALLLLLGTATAMGWVQV